LDLIRQSSRHERVDGVPGREQEAEEQAAITSLSREEILFL